MSFVTTQPEALTAAASALQNLGTSMAAENAAAAAPTTGVAPAAADPVSALQAAQFSAYGTWYQQVSAQATAIHQMLVNTLGTSAGSYGDTEAANQTATGSTSLSGLLGGLTGSGTSSSAVSGAAASPAQVSSSTGATIATPFTWFQNVGAAASDFIALGQGQFLPEAVNWKPRMARRGGRPRRAARPNTGGACGCRRGAGRGRRGSGVLAGRVVGAAQLGRGGRTCGQLRPRDIGGRGLDQRCAPYPAGDDDAGRRAVGGLGRASQVTASARHATASSPP